MDKIKLTALGLMPEAEPTYLNVGDTTIAITPRIPYESVFNMIQWCVDRCVTDIPYTAGPVKRIIRDLALVKWYTNIETKLGADTEELYEIYDFLTYFDIINLVKQHINPGQLEFFDSTLNETLESINQYRNSIPGVVEALTRGAEEDIQMMQGALDLVKDEQTAEKINNLVEFAKNLK